MAPDMQHIIDAFYNCVLLTQVLNKDEDVLKCERLFIRVYNMIATLIVNIKQTELEKNSRLSSRITELARNIAESPYE